MPAAAPADISPLTFWRRRQLRPAREQPLPRQTFRRFWRRLTGFYFPPWVPVAAVIVVVFSILGGLFFARAEAGHPRIGEHWHAPYQIWICGVRHPNIPRWDGGVHTHADGVVHIHPLAPFEEGAGARLVKWFEYGGQALGTGGELSADTLQVPGDKKVYKNGDLCEGGEFDGQPGVVQVFVNGERMKDFSRYIPQDGDRIRIVFGPEEEVVVTPTVEASPAARTITIEAGDRGRGAEDSFFSPDRITIQAGETVELVIKNTGTVSHNLRVSGQDKEYDTDDDLVTEPYAVKPGQEGSLIIRFDQPGTYPFRCDFHPFWQTGILTVEAAAGEEEPTPESTPEPTPEPTP